MAHRSLPRKVTYFEPVPPRLSRNTIIESTFEVGRRFRCTMRVDCEVRRDRREASLRNAPTVSLVSLSGYVADSALSRIIGSVLHETEGRQERPQ